MISTLARDILQRELAGRTLLFYLTIDTRFNYLYDYELCHN